MSFEQKLLKKTWSLAKKLERKQRDRYLSRKSYDEAILRMKTINGGYHGSSREFREKVVSYWKRFGVRPKRFWFDLFCNGQNEYDPRFIPDPTWFCDIIPYFNDMMQANAYADKGIYNRLITGVRKPETVAKNMGGHFYNGDGEQLITGEEAIRLCENEEHLILKPSGGAKGTGILFYDRDDEKCRRIPELFSAMKINFVVQRLVKQHPDLERLNPSSLNTLRVLSFHFKGEVRILSAQLRIGGSGARVDNVAAGGFACPVRPDGRLYEKAVNRESVWTDETPNGIKLQTICVPHYEEVTAAIKRLHPQLPYYNIIGWDFAVGEDGTPVMVEYNTMPAQNQIGCRAPTFGDLTDEVLEEVYIKKSLKKGFR